MLIDREGRVLKAISGQRAWEHVKALVSLGEKVAGSPQEQQAARLVHQALSPYVDSCELEGVPVTGYMRKGASLRLLAPPQGGEVACEVNPLAGVGRGEAVLADAGNGTRADYARGGGWAGRVALVTNDAARRGANLTHLALEAKYQGVVCLIYHLPGMREDIIPVWPVDVALPVLSISNRQAAQLRHILAQGKEVRVAFEAALQRYESTTYNVVGTVRGSRHPHEVIYLTGHYDNWFLGANDNASTVGCLLEVARALQGYRPQRTLRFVAWGSEESGAPVGEWGLYGLMGSYGYGQAHRPEMAGEAGELAVAMVNGEMLGYSPRTHLQCTPELLPLAHGIAADLGEHLRVSGPSHNWTLSDHLCFHALGLPLVYLIPARDLGSGHRSPYWDVYHTAADNMEAISQRALEENARLMALTLLRLDRAAMPYSLASLGHAALQGTEHLPNGRGLRRALSRAGRGCSGGERGAVLRRTRRLVGLVNQHIYALDRPFGLKFPFMAERIARLKEAAHILELEGDVRRARAVLMTLADFSVSTSFSPEVVAKVREMRRANPVLSALALLEGDWTEVLACFEENRPLPRTLSALQAKIDDHEELLEHWARRLEKALV